MRFVSPVDRRRRRQAPYRFRPQLHALEDRCLLSTLWNNFPLADPGSQVSSITRGPDGNVWFTDPGAHEVGRITPTGTITEFALAPASSPGHITAGGDGNLWFTDNSLNEIVRITASGVVTEFPLSADTSGTFSGAAPADIVADHNGNLWFTLANRSDLGRLSLSGTFTDFTLNDARPDNLTASVDGSVWYIDRLHGQIGRISSTGAVTEFNLPSVAGSAATPFDLTAGPDGNLWFTEGATGNQIGRITLAGSILTYDLPAGHAAFGIHSGPDSSLWFTEAGRIGRFNPFTGIMTEFPLALDPPAAFAVGADGNFWFAGGNGVSQLNRSSLPPGNTVSIFLFQGSTSVNLFVQTVSFTPTAAQDANTIFIDWGDGRSLPQIQNFNAAAVFVADHLYAGAGSYTIRLSIAQSNGVFLQAILKTAGALPSPSSFPASGGFGFGFYGDGPGSSDSTGPTPWRSITDHGTPNTPGSPTGTIAFPYATQPREGLTSIPLSQSGGLVLVISLQSSVGPGQGTNSSAAGQMAYSSGSSRADELGAPSIPGSTNAALESSFGPLVDNSNSAVSSTIRPAANYGTRREIGQPSSSGDGEQSAASASVAQTAQSIAEDPGPALIGEPLRGAVPSEQELLAIAREIVAADSANRRPDARSWGWLEKSLVGSVLSVVAAESLIWSVHTSRRRQEGKYSIALSR